METRDSAFLWETEALRSSTSRITQPGPAEKPARSSDWITLRQAAEATGIPISTLRKWARRDSIPTYLEETPTGQLRMVSLSGVRDRAESLGRDDQPLPTEEKTSATSTPPPVTPAGFVPPTEPETPPGTMLVPIDAWDKMLLQLGNLHEAGQQLAEARERAAKAETEANFLRERLAEMRSDLAEARSAKPSRPRSPAFEDRRSEPIAHIPIESDDDEQRDDTEIEVRDLGKGDVGQPEESTAYVDDGEMTLGEYSLEMVKHIYSTWRGRPRR